jgi:IS5 family transposase
MTPLGTQDNLEQLSPLHENATERVDRSAAPRRLGDELDEAGLDLAIQASTSRIVGLALAQRSLEDDSEITWEEGP